MLLASGPGEGLWDFLFLGVLLLFRIFLLRILFLFRVFILRILLFGVFLVRVLRSAFVQGSWRQMVAPCRSWHYVTGTVPRPQFLAILCIVFAEHLTVRFAVLARNEGGAINGRLRRTLCWS